MCTVSWQRSEAGYTLFVNRDEQRTRVIAEPPDPVCPPAPGMVWIAPRDPEGGGTWAFANGAGLSAAILNLYNTSQPPPPKEGGFRSRGLLLRDLTSASNAPACAELLRASLTHNAYRPFLLLILDPDHPPIFRQWDGKALTRKLPHYPFVTTSSYQPSAVAKLRLKAYFRHIARPLAPTEAELSHLHLWHDPRSPETSILMSRSDARTVSILRFSVDADSVRATYRAVLPETPPRPGAPGTVRIPRTTRTKSMPPEPVT